MNYDRDNEFDGIKIIKIPLLLWNIDEDNIVGTVIGTEYEMIGQNPVKIKSMFSERIQKDYESSDINDLPELDNPELLLINISARPSYKKEGSVFPTSESINLSIPMVYGRGTYDSYECYFPLFRENFHCYQKEQIKLLGEHYAKDIIQNHTPEEIYSFLLPSKPWLDEIRVKIKSKRDERRKALLFPENKILYQVAERLPHIKSIRQKIKIFPDTAWEQTEYIERAYNKLLNERANLLLIGEHGVGKSSILHEVIRRIHNLQIVNKPAFWRTTPRQLIRGAKYLGEWQEKCEEVIKELMNSAGVLWLDDIVSLLFIGGDSHEDSLAAFMLPFIKEGKFQIIGEMTPRELDASRRILPGFAEHFQTIRIEEMDLSKTKKIFHLFNDYSSNNYKIHFKREALDLAYRFLSRFIKYEKFPGKAVNFLSDLVSYAIDNAIDEIKEIEVIAAFTDKTGLPEIILRDDLLIDKRELQEYFATRIIGQDHAIEKITSVVKIFKTGINNPDKPIATMIFAGPTGVGKTASVKLLADYFFGHGQESNPLIRLDMSEFQQPDQIKRLIGSGGNKPGKFIQFVRERPFCVVLLDEIEKANPVIFDALMTVFDEGILTDTYGRITDFRNAIIIMTTNLGTKSGESIGLIKSQEKDYIGPIKNYFRPEFFNRIDSIVIFRSLNSAVIKEIAKKELRDLEQREGFAKNKIRLRFSDRLIEFIADIGFDKNYGARPLQRAIEKNITTKLAKYILVNKYIYDCVLALDYINGAVSIEKERAL